MPSASLRDWRGGLALVGLFSLTVVLAYLLMSLGLSDTAAFVTAGIMFTVMWALFEVARWWFGRRRDEHG